MIGTSQQQEASSILCIVIGDDQVISTLAYLGQFQWILLVTSWRMYNETTLWIQSTTNSFFFVKIILFFDDDRSAQPQQSWKKSSKHTALFFCQQHSFLKLCEYRNIRHFLGQKLTIFFEEWGCYIGNQKCDMDAIALAAIRSSTTGILERTEDSMV